MGMRHNLNNSPQRWYSSEVVGKLEIEHKLMWPGSVVFLSPHCHGAGSLMGLCDPPWASVQFPSYPFRSRRSLILISGHLVCTDSDISYLHMEPPFEKHQQRAWPEGAPDPQLHEMNQIMTPRIPALQDVPQAQMCTLRRAHGNSSPTGHRAEFREPWKRLPLIQSNPITLQTRGVKEWHLEAEVLSHKQ